MHLMVALRRSRRRWCAVRTLLLVLGLSLGCLSLGYLSLGCARSDLHRTGGASTNGEQKLPFRSGSDDGSAAVGNSAALAADAKLAAGLPFPGPRSRVLPSGTLLTVQLEDSLSSAQVRAGDVFTASVAAPLTVESETLIERGTAVAGRVEAAQSQPDHLGLAAASGYFRLSLSEITVAGRQVALQTSSLFARGTLQQSGVRLAKGHHLTFRLIAPLALDDPGAVANRQSSPPSSE
jgi:hypothetical protein